jgi:hypothetical protein
MSEVMGKYCKAYLLLELRKYEGWIENSENARSEKKKVDGKEIEEIRELNDDSIVYIQENFVVTDDIYKEKNILFNSVTPEWKEYCTNTLNFTIPDYCLDNDTETVSE